MEECSVCLETEKQNSKSWVTCTSCGFKACKSCCITFSKPECIKCNEPFSKAFAQSSGIVSVFKLYHQKLLWDRETFMLPQTQKFLEWEDTVLQLKKRLRFGERVFLPEKPRLFLTSSANNAIFACPGSDCRGFVGNSTCGVCKRKVCPHCKEFEVKEVVEPSKSQSSSLKLKHACDPALLESIRAIEADSKLCPSCKAQIFRIEGCNHMFCTNCRTHFDWMTSKILSSSSNHHYDKTVPFSRNAVRLGTAVDCSDPLTDAIPPSIVLNFLSNSTKGKQLFRAIWIETSSARYLLRKRLSAFETEVSYQEALLRLRAQFLRKQISESTARTRVLYEDEKHEKMFRQRALLEMYLNVCNDLQSLVYNDQTESRVLHALNLYENLIKVCTQSSAEMKLELGGECLQFSCDFDTEKPHVSL